MASEASLILAFDTTADFCAAALVDNEAVVSSRDEEMTRGQAERLLPMLEEMLSESGRAWSDLDGLAVCTGPGNFTGLRLALAAAGGLASALGVPAVGVTAFEALAAPWPGPLLVTLQDRRGDVLAQTFQGGTATSKPIVADLAFLGPFDPKVRCVGYRACLIARKLGLVVVSEKTRVDAAIVARVAARRLDKATPLSPLYLRPADAMPSSDRIPALLDDA